MVKAKVATNVDIVVYSLAILGGAESAVHSEDIAAKCYELAPSRFSWRLPAYREKGWPDKHVVKTTLQDAKKKKYGALVEGTYALDITKDGWRLTSQGANWYARNANRVELELDLQSAKVKSPTIKVRKGNVRSAQSTLTNHEVVTLAVFLLGGESHYVDTEDVAVKANEIVPHRFTWRKYPEQINIDTVRKRLWDGRKPERAGYLVGSEKDGWLLTENGLEFARKRIRDLESTGVSKKPLSLNEKRRFRSERIRMLTSEVFSKFQTEGVDAVTAQQAEVFFRIDDYVVGDARQRKIDRTLTMFGEDPELGRAVRQLANKVRRGERNERIR